MLAIASTELCELVLTGKILKAFYLIYSLRSIENTTFKTSNLIYSMVMSIEEEKNLETFNLIYSVVMSIE